MTSPAVPGLAAAMRTAAARLAESLPTPQRQALSTVFGGPEQRDWTYLPGVRPGIRLGDLTAEQRGLALDLLQTAYSPRGLSDLQLVLTTEEARRRLSDAHWGRTGPDPVDDPEYWVRLQGVPGPGPWAWRVSGHHLVAQATLVGEDVALTPQFFGAQPARLPAGPHAGLQSLAREEDLARALVVDLQQDQRRVAVVSAVAPYDILSRRDPVLAAVEETGLSRARMDRRQGDLLEAVVRQYLDRAPSVVADAAWSALVDAGWSEVRFRWAGGLAAGEGHYYAVSGPTFLLEYDNSQDGADHVHCVWRDRQRDFGGDVLAHHHRTDHPGSAPAKD